MLIYWVVGTFIGSALLSIVVEQLARKFGAVSKVSYRRKLQESTPLWGGIAVIAAAIAGTYYFSPKLAGPLFLAYAPLLFMGALDDRVEVSGRWKLTAQILSACLWVMVIPKEALIFSTIFNVPLVGQALTLAWIIGLTNAFNLIDGVDGQASSLGIVNWLAISMFMQDSQVGWIMAASLAGFLVRNFNPAQIYLGEVGSSFLGFSLAAMTSILPVKGAHFGHFVALVFLFSLPLFDVVSAMIRRLGKGVSLFTGDREHIHHCLFKLQFSVIQTLFIMVSLAFAGSLTFVLALKMSNVRLQAGIFVLGGSLLLLCYFGIHYCERHFSQRMLGLGRSLLGKHLMPNAMRLELVPKRSIVVDLLPYFRELQSQGIVTLNEFLGDLSRLINDLSKSGRVDFLGSYAIAILYSNKSSWSEEEIEQISERFTAIFRAYHCRRSLSATPEGIEFCGIDRTQRLLPALESAQTEPSRMAA